MSSVGRVFLLPRRFGWRQQSRLACLALRKEASSSVVRLPTLRSSMRIFTLSPRWLVGVWSGNVATCSINDPGADQPSPQHQIKLTPERANATLGLVIVNG